MKTCTNCGHELLMSYDYNTAKKTGLKCPILNCKEFKAPNHSPSSMETKMCKDTPEGSSVKVNSSGTNATDNTGCNNDSKGIKRKIKKKQITFTLDVDLIKDIKSQVQKGNLSFYVNGMLKTYLRLVKGTHKKESK